MTPDQFTVLMKAMAMPHHYTLTGADDYPILVASLGVLIALGIYIWQDLKYTIKEHRAEWHQELADEIGERKDQDSFIWKALREHKDDCTKERELRNGRE